MPKQLEGNRMRKKTAMRKGGKVAKYQAGGTVRGQRPTEDRARMVAEAAAGFDAEEENLLARRRAANPRLRGQSLITNRPVGVAPRTDPARLPVVDTGVDATGGGAAARPMREPLPVPPIPPQASPRARQAVTATRSRSREMSADELNEREMTRILNERSLEAARAGRSMYKRGGKVAAKKRK